MREGGQILASSQRFAPGKEISLSSSPLMAAPFYLIFSGRVSFLAMKSLCEKRGGAAYSGRNRQACAPSGWVGGLNRQPSPTAPCRLGLKSLFQPSAPSPSGLSLPTRLSHAGLGRQSASPLRGLSVARTPSSDVDRATCRLGPGGSRADARRRVADGHSFPDPSFPSATDW